jgi:hypothetical protein
MIADITQQLAEEFGWQIYQDGHLISGLIGSTKLDGELNLQELSFKVNGTKSDPLECVATMAVDFQLSRRKTETGDGIETNLRFILKSLAWKELTEFFGLLGESDGVLTLELQPATLESQQTLDEQPHLVASEEDPQAAADPEPAEETPSKSRRGALASRVAMEKIQ